MLQQEKQHVHEKEMQQQKLQEEKKQGQDVNVVHLQEKLQGEELPEEEEDARTSYSFFKLHLIRTVKISPTNKLPIITWISTDFLRTKRGYCLFIESKKAKH